MGRRGREPGGMLPSHLTGDRIMPRLSAHVFAAAAVLTCSVASAQSITVNFTRVSNNGNTNVASQLRMVVSSLAGGTQTQFRFTNTAVVASSIDKIVWAFGLVPYTAGAITDSGSSVNFAVSGNTNLPSAPSGFTDSYAIRRDGGAAKGVNAANEFVNIVFTANYNDIVAGLANGNVRVGLHVISIGAQAGSDTYVNVRVVPLPAAAWAGLGTMAGIAGVAALRRRTRA